MKDTLYWLTVLGRVSLEQLELEIQNIYWERIRVEYFSYARIVYCIVQGESHPDFYAVGHGNTKLEAAQDALANALEESENI